MFMKCMNHKAHAWRHEFSGIEDLGSLKSYTEKSGIEKLMELIGIVIVCSFKKK